ncbi:hypothetical protein [Streptomyces wuyuanensis]|uniref:hypothetical protein n=1 Tax=Streptomyces wuyuanensis TaxID=1196353 RepID=UPI00341AA696
MLHTVLRRRANGESVEQIQPDLIIPTGKRKGQAPSVASIYRAIAEHKKQETYPEAVAQAHADFADLQDADDIPAPAESASGSRTTRRRRAMINLSGICNYSHPSRNWCPAPRRPASAAWHTTGMHRANVEACISERHFVRYRLPCVPRALQIQIEPAAEAGSASEACGDVPARGSEGGSAGLSAGGLRDGVGFRRRYCGILLETG